MGSAESYNPRWSTFVDEIGDETPALPNSLPSDRDPVLPVIREDFTNP